MSQARLYRADMSPNQLDQDASHDRGGPMNKETDDRAKYSDYWLLIARDAYNESESYYDANIRHNHERNLAHFQNRHAPGSKYYGDSYKFRHKGFRPKTRSMSRRQEASLLRSMFSTADFVKIKAARTNHPGSRVSAEINQKLVQYRLENTIPWFQTVLGAYQETNTLGLCISHQFWDYEELGPYNGFEDEAREGVGPGYTPPQDEQEQIVVGDNLPSQDSNTGIGGEEAEAARYSEDEPGEPPGEVLRDTPAVELRPVENVFFSVAADWRDPANTSPFIIDKIPMFLDEVKAMAQPKRGSSRQPWYPLTESQLLAGITTDYDPVRRQREENREDSKDQRHLHRGFDTVWVHRNIVRKGGHDWIYYTLGVHYRLSEPVPLREEYPWLRPGERPYVFGYSNLEAHKNYPESLVGLGAKTQQDANQLNNTRFDNVELSLNRRYIVKRSAQVDYRGLQRNVPGGVTETDDPNNDIKIENPPDVTSSSYAEQDRINADFDELLGVFSGSSVGTNQSMNETVGGLKLLAGDADALSEYPMMVFMITWVIPVLKQIVRLEQRHESNGALLNLMGEDLELWQRYKVDRVTDQWIQGSMNIQVAANWGAANPEQMLQRLAVGFGLIFNVVPEARQRLEGSEFTKEVLGTLGYQGIERFFPKEGPKMPAGPVAENQGELTESEQGKLDQDHQQHMEKLELQERQMEWDIKKFTMEMENKLEERLLKKEISQQQFDEKMERLKVDRQSKVDEMKIKLREGTGI